MMKVYKIKGQGKYKEYEDIIYCPTSPLVALKSFLLHKKIKYKKITKLTKKVNKDLLEKGINPDTTIDFVVMLEQGYNSYTTEGNYFIE